MVNFILNDQNISTDAPLGLSLLDFVRYHADLKGTKIGCREGDCGACTILIGDLAEDEVTYHSATSCITPLANVHGKHVVTIEGLNISGLNQVQQSMVDHSATQCGFCTPGFVTSLCGFALTKEPKTTSAAISAIDGNICRCTGYKSIERAAIQIAELLTDIDETRPLQWLVDQQFIPEYFCKIGSRLQTIHLELETYVGSRAIGGGTDLFVQQHDEMLNESLHFISLYPRHKGIFIENNICYIKASASATELMNQPEILNAIPQWYDFMKLISSTPIRNIGTIAGNLVNASPIGDFSIILLALEAEIVLENEQGLQRHLPINKFFKDYKVLDKAPEEIIAEVIFTLPDSTTKVNFEKVCKRKYLDIATVNSAISISTDRENKIAQASVSIGGVGPIPTYLHKTSAFLEGKYVNPYTIKEAAQILQQEIKPISDVRGSSEYKRLLARQLFFSHFMHLFGDSIQPDLLL